MSGATPEQKRRVLALIESVRTPQSRRKMRFNTVRLLLSECGDDYDAVHAAVEEYRKAAAKPPKPKKPQGA
jgi:hypothetical protein